MSTERVTVYLDSDEWYPVWSAPQEEEGKRKPWGDPVEVDRETAERWARVFREFDAVQDEIREAAKRAGITE